VIIVIDVDSILYVSLHTKSEGSFNLGASKDVNRRDHATKI